MKYWIAILIVSVLSIESARADFVGVKAGVDVFFLDASGDMGFESEEWSDKSRFGLYVAAEHPVPLLPNPMIRFNQLSLEEAGETYTMDNLDLILYYEILDNGLVSLDLGVNYRIYDGALTRDADLSEGLAMVYGAGQVDLWGTGLFAFADVSVGLDSDQSIGDLNVGLGKAWSLAIGKVVGRVGYRQHDFDVSDFGQVTADLQQSGFFLGAAVHF